VKNNIQYINSLSDELYKTSSLETNTFYGLIEAELWFNIDYSSDLSSSNFIQLHQTILTHTNYICSYFGIRVADDFIWNNIKRIENLTVPPLNILCFFSLSQLYDKLSSIALQLELYEENFTYQVLSLYHLLLLCKAMKNTIEDLSLLPSLKDLEGMLSQNLNVILEVYKKFALIPLFPKYSDIFYLMEKSTVKPVKTRYLLELYENSLNVQYDKDQEDLNAKELYSIPMAQVKAISEIHDNGFSILLKSRMYYIQGDNPSIIKVLWKKVYFIVIRLRKLAEVIKYLDGSSPRINCPCSLSDLLNQKDVNLQFDHSQFDLKRNLTTLSPPFSNQQLVD